MSISAIIPIYNSEITIESTILSLLSKEITEIICVDDGSTDNSAVIIDQLKQKYPHIIYKWQNNQGAAAARNNGVKQATGDYVLFIDSDDQLPVDAVTHYKDAKERFPDGDVYIGTIAAVTSKGIQPINTYNDFPNLSRATLEHYPQMIQSIGPGGKLYRRKVIAALSFDEDVTFCEEHTFNITVFQNNVVMFDKCVYLYNKTNEHSITSDINAYHEYLRDALKVRERVNQLLEFHSQNVKQYYSYRMDYLIVYYLMKNGWSKNKGDLATLQLLKEYIEIAAKFGTTEYVAKLHSMLELCSADLTFYDYHALTGNNKAQQLKHQFIKGLVTSKDLTKSIVKKWIKK